MSASSVAPSYAVKKALLGGGISLLLLTVSACGGKEAADTASAPSAAPATSTSSPSSAPATRESNGIPIKGPAKNVNGKYLQTTLKPDDPIIATFDPKFVTGDAVDTFTSDELREAVRVAEVFTAEEGIDSILNGSNDPADVDAWWEANKNKLTAKLQTEAYEYVKANKTLVIRSAWDVANPDKRQYWYDENSTRVQIRENAIDSVDVSSQWPNSVGVNTKLDYIIWGKDEGGNKYPINVKGNYYLNLKKDETTGGKWLIDGQRGRYEGYVALK